MREVKALPEYDIEKTGLSIFEKILYFFLAHVLFSVLITLVLLSMFDYNVKNAVLNTASSIPVVKNWVPEPEHDEAAESSEEKDETDLIEENELLIAQIEELEQQIAKQEQELEKKQQTIETLEQETVSLKEQLQVQRQSHEEYMQNIRQLASMYGNMNATRAAAIIENLTPSERVLILSEMSANKRGAILERMDPAMAADVSMMMKDSAKSENLEIAALQERLDLLMNERSSEASKLELEDLALLLQGMEPDTAAGVLLAMYEQEEQKAVQIVQAMAAQPRSAILSSMAKMSEAQAAAMIRRLGDG